MGISFHWRGSCLGIYQVPPVQCNWAGRPCRQIGISVRLANSLVRESHVCVCKIFCIHKEGYHPLWRNPIESAPSVDTIERSSPSIHLGCWTESGCVKIARERRIPCNLLTMLGSEVARYAQESSVIYSFNVLWASEINCLSKYIVCAYIVADPNLALHFCTCPLR